MAKKADHGEVFAVRLSTPAAKKLKRIIRSKTNASNRYNSSDALREAIFAFIAANARAAA